MVLTAGQLAYLDRLAIDIRSATGRPIERSAILRALVDAVADSRVDLAAGQDEAGIQQLLSARLKGRA